MKKTTRRALFLSFASMFLCFTMLLGTTYAWFTDSVESGVNQIVAGNLDVKLWHQGKNDTAAVEVTETTTNLFELDANQKWEPGMMVWENFTVENVGDLAFKYQLSFDADPVGSKDLTEVIKVAITDPIDLASDTRDELKKLTFVKFDELAATTTAGTITKDGEQTKTYGVVLYWEPSNSDNDYNMKNGIGDPLSISVRVNLFATQVEAESDSFNNEYDKDAKNPVVDTITVTEDASEVKLSAGNFNVTVPVSTADEGAVYEMVVSNEKTETDTTTGETTVAFDLTMYKNDTKVSGDTVYEVTMNVGTSLFISEVTHNGNALTKATTGADQTYTYDSATGDLTIYTKSFSPFEVTYNTYKDYTITLNRGHNKNSEISVSTGADLLPIVAINPSIAGYSVYDGDNRIANAVTFRFSNVAEQTISENSYKVSFDLAVLDENGNELTIKEGKYNPYINTDLREYLWVYVNLLGAFPDGYTVSGVNVDDTALTASTGDYAPTGGYLIGTDGIYLQTTTAGTFEIILTKAN